MKKLLALLAALLMALPLLASAQTGPHAVITLKSGYREPSVTIGDAAFLDWLMELLRVDSPCDPPEIRPADDVYEIRLQDGSTYAVWHDDLYNRACVTRPDGTVHALSADVPMMLARLLWEPVSFVIPESHRALLQDWGWTIAFRHPHMAVQLPARLEASRTDPAALHFTWADLFLRDAGYDIRPYLGQAVIPHVYTVYGSVPRASFYADDAADVRCSMFAVVLECHGQIIGAYLFAYSWDGSNLMSLRGNAAPALLGGHSIREYLLARLPLTEAERNLAALPPEEVIRRYAATGDPMLTPIDGLLQRLGSASCALWDPLALLPQSGGQSVLSIAERNPEGDVRVFDVRTEENVWFPRLVPESPDTGWKIESFYNTGY